MRRETLPTARIETRPGAGTVLVLDDPYNPENRITCQPYGVMADGTMIWAQAGNDEKQYTRSRFFGKYYFCEL